MGKIGSPIWKGSGNIKNKWNSESNVQNESDREKTFLHPFWTLNNRRNEWKVWVFPYLFKERQKQYACDGVNTCWGKRIETSFTGCNSKWIEEEEKKTEGYVEKRVENKIAKINFLIFLPHKVTATCLEGRWDKSEHFRWLDSKIE